MKTSHVLIASLLELLALGCDPPPPPGAHVDSFRVLAEQADQPYARPGETVQLSSLSFDPEGRAVTWVWASCVNPRSNDLDGCINRINEAADPTSAIFATGEDMSAPKLTVPDDALSSLPEPARGAASLGVVSAACPGDLSLGEGPGGLPFRCQETTTGRELGLRELIVGIKRIAVREHDRNQNPEIASITFDGVDWPADEVKAVGSCNRSDFDYAACPAGDKHQLAAVLTQDSFEAGQDEFGRAFAEQVVIQYYATDGIFEHEVKLGREPNNGWVARRSAAAQTLSLWFVARDDRGGVSWATRQVQVR